MENAREFTGSLVLPIAGVPDDGSVKVLPGPITVVGGSETFYMDVGRSQNGSFQVNVLNIGVAANTYTATQSSGVNTTTGVITTARSGWTGNLVQATSSGTLPTGISGSTNYYIYFVDATHVQLFDTLAHVLLAKALYGDGGGIAAPSTTVGLIIPSTVGTGTLTLTPTALGTTTYILQGSNDFVPAQNINEPAISAGSWNSLATGQSPAGVVSSTISATGTSALYYWSAGSKFARIQFSVGAGTAQIQVIGHS